MHIGVHEDDSSEDRCFLKRKLPLPEEEAWAGAAVSEAAQRARRDQPLCKPWVGTCVRSHRDTGRMNPSMSLYPISGAFA